MIFKKFFQKKKNKIIPKKSKIKTKIMSKKFVKSIFQKSKLFMSRVIFPKKEIMKIPLANQVCQIISFIDSFVMIFEFSIKNIKKLAKIAKNIPKI